MKTFLINILRFLKKKGNSLNPWYIILWRICLFPFVIVFASAFYILTVLFHFDFWQAEKFRKDYF